MGRSTSNDILDEFGGTLKFCTQWLHLSEARAYLYRSKTWDGMMYGVVGCTDLLNDHFMIPRSVDRIAFVFTTGPNGADESTMVRECRFMDFTQQARDDAGIRADPMGSRCWYWHVILDWKD